ncbi:hypothetical protein LRR18_16715, partial [Mangrovimonas sp. AS39]|uniref:hypothetical protein n=1 Tax=Mangrovimonas futianensis TaxID=2895523 RepID=UPI001E2A1838
MTGHGSGGLSRQPSLSSTFLGVHQGVIYTLVYPIEGTTSGTALMYNPIQVGMYVYARSWCIGSTTGSGGVYRRSRMHCPAWQG